VGSSFSYLAVVFIGVSGISSSATSVQYFSISSVESNVSSASHVDALRGKFFQLT